VEVEVLAMARDRPVLEGRRPVTTVFRSGLRSFKHCTTFPKVEDVVICSLRLPLLLALIGESPLKVDGVSGGSILSLYLEDELGGSSKPPLLTLGRRGRRGVTNDERASATDSSLT